MDITRKAIISGGASGLGLATAKTIVEQQGSVTLLDINDAQGQQAASDLGEQAHFIQTDIRDEAAVIDACNTAQTNMGSINTVVNCAGIIGAARMLGRDGPMDADIFQNTININLVGSFLLSKAAANLMQHNEPDSEGERGIIINAASVAAYEGQIGQAAYSASKAGIVGMTLPMARELARFGIRVMTIAPGIFETPMMAGMPEDVQASLGAQVPFPSRLGRPNEFASLVMSIIANPMLNGETIRLDGAIRMQPK